MQGFTDAQVSNTLQRGLMDVASPVWLAWLQGALLDGTGATFEVTLGWLSEITGELWVYSNFFANCGFIQKEEQTSMRNMVRN